MRTIVFTALLGISVLAALAGCGGGGNGETYPTPTPAATPTPTPTPGGGLGRIVYQIQDKIYLINGDGTGKVQVTNPPSGTNHFDPDLSPDGTQITFVQYIYSGSGPTHRLMVVNVDGTNERALTPARYMLRVPRWSPDGSRIAFGSGSTRIISTIRPDGTDEQYLPRDVVGTTAALPDWSPDGTRLVFSAQIDGPSLDIYSIKLDGTGLTRITDTPDYQEWCPRYSADGTKLVCYSGDSPMKQVAVMNADGSGRALIGPAFGKRPSWSHDGTKILFASAGGEAGRNISTMNPDGSDLVHITNTSDIGEDEPSF